MYQQNCPLTPPSSGGATVLQSQESRLCRSGRSSSKAQIITKFPYTSLDSTLLQSFHWEQNQVLMQHQRLKGRPSKQISCNKWNKHRTLSLWHLSKPCFRHPVPMADLEAAFDRSRVLQWQSGGHSFPYSLYFLKVYINSKITTNLNVGGEGVGFFILFWGFSPRSYQFFLTLTDKTTNSSWSSVSVPNYTAASPTFLNPLS